MAHDVRAPTDTAELHLAELTLQHTGPVPDDGNVREIAERNVAAVLPPRQRQPKMAVPYRDVIRSLPRRAAVHARSLRRGDVEQLPDDAVAWIRAARDAEPKPGDPTVAAHTARLPLDHYLHALWLNDWPMSALTAALERTRQRVHDRMYRARTMPLPPGVVLPEVPVRPGPCATRHHAVGSNEASRPSGVRCAACENPNPAPARMPDLPSDVLDQVRDLAQVSARHGGNGPAGRAAALELEALLLALTDRGYTGYRLAKDTGLPIGSVELRIRRAKRRRR